MTAYQVGEVVDITIRGARVVQSPGPEHAVIKLGDDLILIDRALPEVTVTRVAPPEWPPRPGDLWRDRDGRPWFGVDITDYDADKVAPGVELQGQNTYTYGRWAADEINKRYGPLVLVHREPEAGEQR